MSGFDDIRYDDFSGKYYRATVYADQRSEQCPHCGGQTGTIGLRERSAWDIPHEGKPVFLKVVFCAVRCKQCKRETRDAEGLKPHARLTERLQKYILSEYPQVPVKKLSLHTGLAYEAIWKVIRDENQRRQMARRGNVGGVL